MTSLLSESPGDRPSDAESVLRLLDEVRHASNIDAPIAAGESETIEFKSSLHHPYEPLPQDMKKKVELGKLSEAQAQKDVQKELKKAVTKTIAAFLNTSGGTLLIGVNDSGATIGIEADFPYLKPENSMLMAGFRRCRRLSSTRSVLRSGAPFTFR